MGNISSNISAFQSLHIVMLGLDSAGKTTVLYRLKFNEFVNTVPTIGFNTEKIKLSNGTAKGISCHFWDVGGQEKLRPLWKSYSRCTDGIIYVVDSVDVDRLEEAKTELHKVTKFAENQGTPLLVIANKQDLPKSLPVAEIEKQLALHELIPATTYHVQPACAIIGEGLTEGMDKLYEMILKRRKSLKQKKKRARSSGYPALTGDRTCELPEVCRSHNPGNPIWGPGGSGRCWGDRLSLQSWAVKAGEFSVTGAGPCENPFVLLWAPSEVVAWAIRGLPGTGGQPEGPRRCAGLGWGMASKNAPFLVLCGSYGRPVLLRTAFQPGIRHLSFRWFGSCPCCVGHYHTKRPIKILKTKKKNKKQKTCWRWWQMMHLPFAE
uniref:ADP ribosylation factor like GTPase 4C n=1 Tax=Sus scrofa TaxID=9823 RepID=A0A4X1TD66_PIG